MRQGGGLVFPGQDWAAQYAWRDNQTVLRITGRHDPPFLTVEPAEGGGSRHSGYLLDLWKLIAAELGIRWRMVEDSPNGYGSKLPNGSWNGVIGELVGNRADVGLSWLSYNYQRGTAVEFLDAVPVATDAYSFYVREGTSQSFRLDYETFSSLLKPLHNHVWLTLLASLFVISVVLWITIRFSLPSSETKETRLEFGLASCHLHSYMSMVGQGWAATPGSVSARIVTIFGWALGLLIYVNYTANLVSDLAVVQVNKPLKNLAQFVSQPDWRLASEDGVAAYNDWEDSSDLTYNTLYRIVTGSSRHLTVESNSLSLQRCLEPDVLCFHDLNRLFYFLGREACHFHSLLDEKPVKNPTFMVVRRGLRDLRTDSNIVMQRLLQTGSLEGLRRRWFPNNIHSCSNNNVFNPLTLPELFAVVFIIPMACVVSCVMLVLEIVARRLGQTRRSARTVTPNNKNEKIKVTEFMSWVKAHQ